jgi:hypothetical protein
VVTPASAWTGEALVSGGSYVRMPAGADARWQVPAAAQPRLILPVIDLQPGSSAVTHWSAGTSGKLHALGEVRHGQIGPQGASPAPGALLPVTPTGTGELRPGATQLVATSTGGDAVVDAVMLEPLVSRYVIEGDAAATAMLRSAARSPQTVAVVVPGSGTAVVETYDAAGARRVLTAERGSTVPALVLPGGFTVVRR